MAGTAGEPDMADPAAGPLAGVVVLDLTSVVMGPSATQILGDLGADVIKVEPPGGDSMRGVGPARSPGMGPMYLQANRNKRSVRLDLKSPEGTRALHGLIRRADVLVHNIRPAAAGRRGLAYPEVAGLNPGIVYCGAVGYGSRGPAAGQAVYDDIMQAACGISGIFQHVDGEPRYAPVNICDRVVGLYLVIAVVSALYHRRESGQGQQIEVPMFETMAQFVLADHLGGYAFWPPIGSIGYPRLLSRHRGPHRTADGYLSVVVYTDEQWRRFGAIIGQPGLLQSDVRLASQQSRTAHAEHVGQFIARQLRTRPTDEWLRLLQAADIPASPVCGLEDLLEDPQLHASGLFERVQHPTEGTVLTCRFPVEFSKTPATMRRLAPRLGQHTAELLTAEDTA